jgi:hypothetical protein
MYVNTWTHARSREKPKLLGPEDCAEPKDEFRVMRDTKGRKYYFNPATGTLNVLVRHTFDCLFT